MGVHGGCCGHAQGTVVCVWSRGCAEGAVGVQEECGACKGSAVGVHWACTGGAVCAGECNMCSECARGVHCMRGVSGGCVRCGCAMRVCTGHAVCVQNVYGKKSTLGRAII